MCIRTVRLVELAKRIRNIRIGGFMPPQVLDEFDRLARFNRFGIHTYQGEARKLMDAKTGQDYYIWYPKLQAIFCTIIRNNINVAA